LGQCFGYHFQPFFLKSQEKLLNISSDKQLSIASVLGEKGEYLQAVLSRIQKDERERQTFDRFLTALRRFEPSFHGVLYEKEQLFWQFDLGRIPARPDSFSSEVVSDGLLKAAAVALLSAMWGPPAIILLEEIGNGISQENLRGFIDDLLRQGAGVESATDRGYRTQFIITSHNPSVLRLFADSLNEVFYVRLDRKHGYRSMVTSLNTSLASFIDLGTVEGESEERNGKRIVKISPEDLMQLWYSGAIGGGLL